MAAGGSRQGVAAGRARFLTFLPRVLDKVSRGNGVRKSTDCADRRGIRKRFPRRCPRKSQIFASTRNRAICGRGDPQTRTPAGRRNRSISGPRFHRKSPLKRATETSENAHALPLPHAGYPLPATPRRHLLPLPPPARSWRQRARQGGRRPAGGGGPAALPPPPSGPAGGRRQKTSAPCLYPLPATPCREGPGPEPR